jgi:hypothetical protein
VIKTFTLLLHKTEAILNHLLEGQGILKEQLKYIQFSSLMVILGLPFLSAMASHLGGGKLGNRYQRFPLTCSRINDKCHCVTKKCYYFGEFSQRNLIE